MSFHRVSDKPGSIVGHAYRPLLVPSIYGHSMGMRAQKVTPSRRRIVKQPLCDTHDANSCQPSEAVSWLASDHPQCLRPDRFFRTSTVARGMQVVFPARTRPLVQRRQGRPHRKSKSPRRAGVRPRALARWSANAAVPATASSSLTPWLSACQDSLVAAESLPTAPANRYHYERTAHVLECRQRCAPGCPWETC